MSIVLILALIFALMVWPRLVISLFMLACGLCFGLVVVLVCVCAMLAAIMLLAGIAAVLAETVGHVATLIIFAVAFLAYHNWGTVKRWAAFLFERDDQDSERID